MNIAERAAGVRDRLAQLVRTEKAARLRDRYRAVLLALDGGEAPAIAAKLGRSRRAVQDWCYRCHERGLGGLPPTPQPGQPQRLLKGREEELRARLDAGPTDADGGVCTLRGRDVAAILAREFGVKYTLDCVHCLLHRLGYSSLAPRPRHENADAEAQARFREQAPLLHAPFATRSGPAAGGCGPSSSTGPALGGRGR